MRIETASAPATTRTQLVANSTSAEQPTAPEQSQPEDLYIGHTAGDDESALVAQNWSTARAQTGSKPPPYVIINGATPKLPGSTLMHACGLQHQWILTSNGKSGGMGNQVGVPGENGQTSPDLPFSATQVVDHTGRRPETTYRQPGLDMNAVESYLKPGLPTGPWTPILNDCNTFVKNVQRYATPHDLSQGMNDAMQGQDSLPILLPRLIPNSKNVVQYSDGTIHPAGELSR